MLARIRPATIGFLVWSLVAMSAHAHRTSGLLQASLVDVQAAQVGVEVTLLPGMDMASKVYALLDTDGDGGISESERSAWGKEFLSRQTVTLDGRPLPITLQSVRAAPLSEMKEGHSEIVVHFIADLGPGVRGAHALMCANRYSPVPCSYQSNGLVPKDPSVRITAHRRDEQQHELTLDVAFGKNPASANPTTSPSVAGGPGLPSVLVLCGVTLALGGALAVVGLRARQRSGKSS